MREIAITPAISALLAAIMSKEAPEGYGQVFGGIKAKDRIDVTKKTVGEVLLWQADLRKRKVTKSTAAGGYQFIYMTLAATVREMGISLETPFNKATQDRMAVYLMQKRGLGDYIDGKITEEQFANNLAKEWASLPVVSRIKGPNKRAMLEPGQSYYDGDNLNAAHHDPAAILRLVRAIRAPQKAAQPVPTPPAPTAPPTPESPQAAQPAPPRGLLKAILDLILAIFAPKKG